ncbi:MAG: 50S ribosomal protein L9 [Parachlamydiales bacterium]|jgi:large subunit ribosomal protein L9
MSRKQQLLLIEDVDDLGKSGEIVSVKAGYFRNFLLPQKKAVLASQHTLRMQQKLQEERAKKAVVDKAEAEALAKKIENITLSIHVKVDPEGKMYGSVSAQDIVQLFEKENLPVERRNLQLKHPLKETGVFEIRLRLKEGVETFFHLKVIPEEVKKDEPAL